MHLGLKPLREFLAAHAQAPALVLATVIGTEGSTYRKPGAMMLIDRAGDFAGLVSGGCLEGDLVGHAAAVFADGQARLVSYDLKDDDDLLLGLGLGCGGAVHLLLQRLERADDFAPLGPLLTSLEQRHPCRLALVCEAGGELSLGAWALQHAAQEDFPGGAAASHRAGPGDPPFLPAATLDGAGEGRLLEALRGLPWSGRRAEHRELLSPAGEGTSGFLLIEADPNPQVLICGAGPDVPPLARQVLALGWECTVTDHRPAFLTRTRFPEAVKLLCLRAEALAGAAVLAHIDAAVVMSHHVGHDAHYLAALAHRPPRYLGLLGPRARRERLLEEIGQPALPVHGPAGLDIGAELPEAIALAIIAEIHAVFAARSGQSLTGRR